MAPRPRAPAARVHFLLGPPRLGLGLWARQARDQAPPAQPVSPGLRLGEPACSLDGFCWMEGVSWERLRGPGITPVLFRPQRPSREFTGLQEGLDAVVLANVEANHDPTTQREPQAVLVFPCVLGCAPV